MIAKSSPVSASPRLAEKPGIQARSGNRRALFNFWLDASLLAVLMLLIWSSVVVRLVFPPGPSAAGWLLWGKSFDDWAGVQFGLVGVLAFGVLIHVMLHWSWVCGVVTTRWTQDKKARLDEGLQTIYGVGFLILLLGILGAAIALAALMIQPPY